MRWPGWLERAPSLVAETLAEVRDPLAAWLRPGAPAAPDAVASALARALLPKAADEEPPPWLRPDQRLSFRRALAAVRRHGGALLADPVGTGKTYIALAAAAALEPGRPIHVLAPASLRRQWREAAARVGLEARVHSHETLSRGRPPPSRAGAVVIDESHRFRNPATRRYAVLAPWCVGRRGLLVSATPAVNRLEDVAHQLLLLVRDDALAWSGVPSLRSGLGRGGDALAHLIVTGEDRSGLLPSRRDREVRPVEASGSAFACLLEGLEGLRLSRDAQVAALVRGVLLQALASSPAAIAEALARYRALLRHARDAAADGRRLSRDAIRRLAGPEGEQLVLWPLIAGGEEDAPAELDLDDLPLVESISAEARRWSERPDAKIAGLRSALPDAKPTLVFTTATATVRYVRRHLGRNGVAWCTGRSAGIDSAVITRDAVLDWFRRAALPEDQVLPRPRVLVATDVAAEGLDLPLVERVVHYDLPWTAVRLEQRNGRGRRLGARHAEVEVLTFLPPPALEAALRTRTILDLKAALPALLGLGPDPAAPWRQRARIAAAWRDHSPAEGTAWVRGQETGVVAGFRIRGDDGSALEVVLARTAAGWTQEPATIGRLLQAADGIDRTGPANPARLRSALRGLAPRVRSALRTAQGARVMAGQRGPGVTGARRRLIALARHAAERRDSTALALAERGLTMLRRGQTAGEARCAASWASLSEDGLRAALARLPPVPGPPAPVAIEIIGVLLVEEEAARLASPDGGDHHGPLRPRRDPHRFGPAHPRQLSPHAGDPRARADE